MSYRSELDISIPRTKTCSARSGFDMTAPDQVRTDNLAVIVPSFAGFRPDGRCEMRPIEGIEILRKNILPEHRAR